MNWGIEDFAAALAIVAVTGIALTIVHKLFRGRPLRLLASAGVVFVALAIWAHLAVGIFT